MKFLSIVKPDAVAERVPDERLDAVLEQLKEYGQPRLGIYNGKGLWHCGMEMNTTAVGIRFEAKSDYDHSTPLGAAQCCRDRIKIALAALAPPR